MRTFLCSIRLLRKMDQPKRQPSHVRRFCGALPFMRGFNIQNVVTKCAVSALQAQKPVPEAQNLVERGLVRLLAWGCPLLRATRTPGYMLAILERRSAAVEWIDRRATRAKAAYASMENMKV